MEKENHLLVCKCGKVHNISKLVTNKMLNTNGDKVFNLGYNKAIKEFEKIIDEIEFTNIIRVGGNPNDIMDNIKIKINQMIQRLKEKQ